MPVENPPPKPTAGQTRCQQLVALLDSAERIMTTARRRGAPGLGPRGVEIIDNWFSEKKQYEACERLCEFCPLRPRHPNTPSSPVTE